MRRFSLLLAALLSIAPAWAGQPRHPLAKAELRPLPPSTLIERVVVKFQEGTHVRLSGGLLVTSKRDPEEDRRLTSAGLSDDQVLRDLATVQWEAGREKWAQGLSRLFKVNESELAAYKALGEARSGRELADLDLYYELTVAPGTTYQDVEDLLARLNAVPSVELAYALSFPRPAAADIPPTTPNFQKKQGYLKAAPLGIDALYSWTQAGGKGQGAKIVDVEYGWLTTHEDMPSFFHTGGVQTGFIDHGTAVMGELAAVDNGYGVTGIANQAQVGYESAGSQSTSSAIMNAALVANVIVIELHQGGPVTGNSCSCNPGQCDYLPMEWSQDVFDAIANATAAGVFVVEAAGNGSANLDNATFYGRAFDRTFRDSGAILAGASLSSDGATPTCWTNYGSRVDLHGWGENVVTMGYGDLFNGGGAGDPNQYYTAFFNGTSSATPIVAGAVADLKGVALANGLPLTPAQARSLLVGSGTPQAPSAQHIGPLPDLHAAIPALLNRPLNLIQNPAFEAGVLSPWFKYPAAAPGIVAVESCCGNQTPSGTWDGYIQPQGQYVEMTQNVSLSPGKRYRLQATLSTKGMAANLYWYTNVSGNVLCASTTVAWPAVTRLQCDFTVPFGTTSANVHLAGTAPAGKWALSDDWSLTDINDLPPPVNQPPAVSLSSPAPGQTFTAPATVQLNATASDSDGSVTQVEFFQGATLLATDTVAPFAFIWSNVPVFQLYPN